MAHRDCLSRDVLDSELRLAQQLIALSAIQRLREVPDVDCAGQAVQGAVRGRGGTPRGTAIGLTPSRMLPIGSGARGVRSRGRSPCETRRREMDVLAFRTDEALLHGESDQVNLRADAKLAHYVGPVSLGCAAA